MAFAILRVKKHSGTSANRSLSGMTKHNKREIPTPNANPELTHLNKEIIGSGNYQLDADQRIKETKAMLQKNGVKTIEHMMTASPEFFDSFPHGRERAAKEFTLRAIRFLKDTYGEDNVTSVSLHMDERTPHLHAFVVPIVQGKLKNGREVNRVSARSFIHGKQMLSDMQTNFASYFNDLQLERGRPKSKAKHTSIQRYYELINSSIKENPFEDIKLPEIEEKPSRFGDLEEWKDRQNELLQDMFIQELKKLEKWAESQLHLKTKEYLESLKYEDFQKTANEIVGKLQDEIIEGEKDHQRQYSRLRKHAEELEKQKINAEATARTQKDKSDQKAAEAKYFAHLAIKLYRDPKSITDRDKENLQSFLNRERKNNQM